MTEAIVASQFNMPIPQEVIVDVMFCFMDAVNLIAYCMTTQNNYKMLTECDWNVHTANEMKKYGFYKDVRPILYKALQVLWRNGVTHVMRDIPDALEHAYNLDDTFLFTSIYVSGISWDLSKEMLRKLLNDDVPKEMKSRYGSIMFRFKKEHLESQEKVETTKGHEDN